LHVQHSPEIWAEHPDLVAGVVFATGTDADASTAEAVARYAGIASPPALRPSFPRSKPGAGRLPIWA
jgi:hypothetical protein